MLVHCQRRLPNTEPMHRVRRDVTPLCLLRSVLHTQAADRGS